MGKIIWLASYPKSGNTWVRAFLANLFADSDQPVEINVLDRFCSSLTARARFDFVAGGSTTHHSPQDTLRLRDRVQRAICEGTSESVFVKTHSRFGEQFGLPLIEPECTAGAVYIVRNPTDVVVSAASHYGVSLSDMAAHMADPNFRTAPSGKHVEEYIGSWSNNVASWTSIPHPKIRVLRYEDLHQNPMKSFSDLVAFLGLAASSKQITRAIQFSEFDAMAAQEKAAQFKERSSSAPAFFRRGRPGGGDETLPADLVRSIKASHSEQMARFGY